MLSLASRSRSQDAPVRRGPSPRKNLSHETNDNSNLTIPANFGSVEDSLFTTNPAIASYLPRDITLVLGLGVNKLVVRAASLLL